MVFSAGLLLTFRGIPHFSHPVVPFLLLRNFPSLIFIFICNIKLEEYLWRR